MNDDPFPQDTDRLVLALQQMRSVDVGPMPNEVLRQAIPAISGGITRHSSQTAAMRISTVAIVVLVSLSWMVLSRPSGTSQAFAQVVARVDATKTLRAVIIDAHEGGRLVVAGTRARFENPKTVVLFDAATREELMLDREHKLAYRIPQPGISRAIDFYGVFRAVAGAVSTPIADHIHTDGRRLFGLSGKTELKLAPATTWNVAAKVWSDPATKLPVRMELRSVEPDGREFTLLVDEIEFDVPVDEAALAMTIPADMQLVGLSADQLKPAPTEEEASRLVLIPHEGIGAVKFGMSRGEIVAILGEPEFVLHGVYLCYPSRGLQLVLSGREPDKLGMIIANPYDAGSLVRHEFRGQTDTGLRIGSNKQQVREVYGAPDAPLPQDAKSRADVERYSQIGLMFGFVDSRVQQIILTR